MSGGDDERIGRLANGFAEIIDARARAERERNAAIARAEDAEAERDRERARADRAVRVVVDTTKELLAAEHALVTEKARVETLTDQHEEALAWHTVASAERESLRIRVPQLERELRAALARIAKLEREHKVLAQLRRQEHLYAPEWGAYVDAHGGCDARNRAYLQDEIAFAARVVDGLETFTPEPGPLTPETKP